MQSTEYRLRRTGPDLSCIYTHTTLHSDSQCIFWPRETSSLSYSFLVSQVPRIPSIAIAGVFDHVVAIYNTSPTMQFMRYKQKVSDYWKRHHRGSAEYAEALRQKRNSCFKAIHYLRCRSSSRGGTIMPLSSFVHFSKTCCMITRHLRS